MSTDQPQAQANKEDFQDYDPVAWEKAASGTKADFTIYDEEAENSGGVPHNSPIPESEVPASEAEFVRALRNCRQGSKPHFQKGDILRVINKARRSGLSGEWIRVESGPLDAKVEVRRRTIRGTSTQTPRGSRHSEKPGL